MSGKCKHVLSEQLHLTSQLSVGFFFPFCLLHSFWVFFHSEDFAHERNIKKGK